MILSFLLALLAFGALLPIIAPLLKGARPIGPRGAYDQAVYRDQLHELERDIARGLVTPVEAEAAKLEIQRRLLAAERLQSAPSRLSRSPAVAVVVFLFISLGSVGVYLIKGTPGLPDVPYASRPATGDNAEAASMRSAVEALAGRLKQDPSDVQSWLLYARSLSALGDWDKAEAAYRQAMALGQNGPEIQADHAETMVMQAHGTVTPAAEAAFDQVLAKDPQNSMARYYQALGRAQAGEPRRAINGLQSLLASLPATTPMRDQIGQQIAAIAKNAGLPVPDLAPGIPGPDPAAMANAAAMPDAQREAMIRGMVANLAAKQQENPGNLEGWLRLGQAYAVLHEDDNAAEAYAKAAALKPDDISIPLTEVRALLSGHKPTDRLPPRVIDLLKQVQARAPNEPVVLWYLGIAAVQDGHPDVARGYWQTLIGQLPEGSDDRKMIQGALDTLAAH